MARRFLAMSGALTACLLFTAITAAVDSVDSVARTTLQQYCVPCHGPEKPKAGIRLDLWIAEEGGVESSEQLTAQAQAEEIRNWKKAIEAIQTGEMPPATEPQPSDGQRTALVQWLEQRVRSPSTKANRRQMRRLSNREYQNTMSDLLGIEMDFLQDLPPDPVSHDGFYTGDSLQLSPIQLETYLATARRALERVIVDEEQPQVYRHIFHESNVKKWMKDSQRSNRLGRSQEFLAKMETEYPERGEFVVRIVLNAELKPDVGYPLLDVSVGYRPDTQLLFREFPMVEVDRPGEHTFTFNGRIEDFPLPVRGQGKFPGLVVRVRNAYTDNSPLPKKEQREDKSVLAPEETHLPILEIQSVEFEGPIFDSWPPKSHRSILFESQQSGEKERSYVRRVIRRFVARAYRRPVERGDIRPILQFYDSIRGEFPTLESAIRETLAFVLIQPDFLYHIDEPEPTRPLVANYRLASRLAYFLWRTMPDAQLLAAAQDGSLRNEVVLQNEVERLLSDARSEEFIQEFTNQWLGLANIEQIVIDPDLYPNFDESLKADFQSESQQLFAELIRTNSNAMELLTADFAMLNERLAKHYGIPDVWGISLRPVTTDPTMHRGGLLGQAGILMAGSTGADSHPVRRAVWIRDRLLGDPPPPPPADVPSLEDGDPAFHQLPLREQLVRHRESESCAGCHRDLDPWGVALEHYDAVGHWRDEVRRKTDDGVQSFPVVAEDTFSDGTKIAGTEELKNLLTTQHQHQFVNALVHRLLGYALGCDKDWLDPAEVEQIGQEFESHDYRMLDLIQAIVRSPSFQGIVPSAN